MSTSTDQPPAPAIRPLGRAHATLDLIVRVLLAAFFISYGVAKLLGTQFIRDGFVLDLLISEASGFELTWAYFGYSLLYSHAIALGQIVFGGLLLFGRTKRLASLGLMTIVLNIVLVNFAYNISPATTGLSLVLLAMNAYLLWLDLPALRRFFWEERPPLGGDRPSLRTAAVTIPVLLLGAFALGSLARGQMRADGPLAGDWRVEELTVDGQPARALPVMPEEWEKIHFEAGRRFSVRTDRGIFHGTHTFAGDSLVTLRFIPRSYRRDRVDHDEPGIPALEWIEVPFRLELAADGSRAILRAHDGRHEIGLTLRPWVWRRM